MAPRRRSPQAGSRSRRLKGVSLAELVLPRRDDAVPLIAPEQVTPVKVRRYRHWLYPALVPSLGTLALCIYILRLPHVLYGTNQYDDGVYMGAAMRLVHGVIPYRDFILVHPPGIVILMAPIALMGNLLGTNVALALGRELTAVVAAANVVLVAAVVRHRGRTACLVAATAMACFPMAAAADSTLFLEPYLVFFCLAGLALMFSEGRVSSTRRVVLGGLLIGFAGTVKVWAAFVVIAMALVCLRRVKSALLPLLVASTAGFIVPCLPFLLMSPHGFVRDILGDQFSRAVSGGTPVTWIVRLIRLTGMEGVTLFRPTTVGVVIVVVSFVCLVGAVFTRRRRTLLPADWAVLSGSIATVIELWTPHEMYSHYVYFSAAFLAMLLAVCVDEALGFAPAIAKRRTMVAIAGCVGAAIFLIPQQAGYATSNLRFAKDPTFLNLFIPTDSCILSDNVELLISSDLFDARRPGCPVVTDSFGTWLAQGPKQEPTYINSPNFGRTVGGPFSSQFVNEWSHWLNQSNYVVEMSRFSGYIPWTPALKSWFTGNFHLVYTQFGLWIFHHVGNAPPPVVY